MSALGSQRDGMLRAWLASATAYVNAEGVTAENRAAMVVGSCALLGDLQRSWALEPESAPEPEPAAASAEPAKRRGRPPGSKTRRRKDEAANGSASASNGAQPALPMGAPSP